MPNCHRGALPGGAAAATLPVEMRRRGVGLCEFSQYANFATTMLPSNLVAVPVVVLAAMAAPAGRELAVDRRGVATAVRPQGGCHDLSRWLQAEEEMLRLGWGENGRPASAPEATPAAVIRALAARGRTAGEEIPRGAGSKD